MNVEDFSFIKKLVCVRSDCSGADKHENCALCEESTKFGTDVAYDGISRFGYGATSKMTSLPFYGGLKHGTEAES